MKLIFNHEMGFGKMQQQVLLYYPFGAFFELHERKEALETGWFPINNKLWYQSRSTRIDLSLYKPAKKIAKLAKKIKCYPSLLLDDNKKQILEKIYQKYLSKKNYNKTVSLTINDMIDNSHGCMYYTYENNIVAFSFYKIIEDNYLSVEFAWDYENPKLSIGHISIYLEAIFAKNHRCKYMYLSSGYESCSLYKSEYPGFQWWKGYEWSNDIELYRKLCLADDKVNILNFDA